tara:strand:+ start:426 stop:1595 length:1170 start_codon:yes stop_codon:yes gene_type:complete
MSNLTDFFGASIQQAPIPYQQVVIGESKTWTVPRTGKIKVLLTGGGGQGAFGYTYSQGYTSVNLAITGGGAGGLCSKIIDVTAGETFTIAVGAGGFQGTLNISSTTAGGAGGASTFVTGTAAATVNMSAGGGGGGNVGSSLGGATVSGGAGGTASGGDDNLTGGRGGNITNSATNQGLSTGGGAVALYGSAYNGGDINFTDTYAKLIATGGAGVGGHGGSFSAYNQQQYGASDGGSSTKAALAEGVHTATYGLTLAGVSTSGSPTSSPTISIVDAQGSGGTGRKVYNTNQYVADTGGYGGGGGGLSALHNHSTNSYSFHGGAAGGFAGGGACTFCNQNGNWSTWSVGSRPGTGGTGGGGSGAVIGAWHGSTNPHGWYAAPDGLCIISYI